MTDLTDRLRGNAASPDWGGTTRVQPALLTQAANEIDRLTAQVASLTAERDEARRRAQHESDCAEAYRSEAEAMRNGLAAALDFAGTVAGGASWWDDVWAEHEAAIDRAREGGADL